MNVNILITKMHKMQLYSSVNFKLLIDPDVGKKYRAKCLIKVVEFVMENIFFMKLSLKAIESTISVI
jgi:hypothetical protein